MPDPIPLRQARLAEIAALAPGADAIEVPRYARHAERRICHIGVGGFHRAHQAHYLHRLLQQGLGEGWGICGIGLRPADAEMHRRLRAQDGLYTLTETDQAQTRRSVIGSIMDHIDASADSAHASAWMADAATRIVSLTITEAGYCLGPGGELDLHHPDIAADLRTPQMPRSAPGLIVASLARRRSAGLSGLTLMSCDNLIGNGRQLLRSVLGYAEALDPQLARWIAREASFPLSMVDRITPALDGPARAALCARLGVADAAPVLSEVWSQWVLEDAFVAGRPAWEHAGAVLSDRVAQYEDMKVGLLNGGHSALSHLGLLAGHTTVHAALDDEVLRAWLECYMASAAQTLPPLAGVDFSAYRAAVIRRFRNPAIADRLLRLSQDSSMKFRQTLLPCLYRSLRAGRPIQTLSAALALWISYLAALDRGERDRAEYLDVNRDELIRLASLAYTGEPAAFLQTALQPDASCSELLNREVAAHLNAIRARGAMAYAAASFRTWN